MRPKRGLERLIGLLAAGLMLTLAHRHAWAAGAAADTSRAPAAGAAARPNNAPATAKASPADSATTPRDAAPADSAATPNNAPPAKAPARVVSPDDTTLGSGARLPGTRLRFGDGAGRARQHYALAPGDPGEVGGDELQLAGDVMYFGMPSKGKLVFNPGGLTRASFEVANPSPHQRDYLEDQLTRAGYRRQCSRRDERGRECDWTGALLIHVKCDTTLMTAEVVSVGAELTRSIHLPTPEERAQALEAARLQPFLSDPTPILPDTLSIDPAAPPGRLSPPMLIKTAPPIYDDALASRGVKGVVQVLALVGLDGLVHYSRATDGPEELHEPAMRTVTHFRFSGYLYNGQKVRFWVWIPVRFGV